MKEKVVLAYSGGLDTTALIPWLKETFDYDVVCCCVNCGQGNELDGLEERAKMSGASNLYIEDIVDKNKDSVRFYYMGNNWKKKVDHIGIKVSANFEDDVFLI